MIPATDTSALPAALGSRVPAQHDGADLAERAVNAIEDVIGAFAGARRAHAKGKCFRAIFTPSRAVRELTTAAHFHADSTRAVVRFSSNAISNPQAPDNVAAGRSIAVKFELPDGTETDIVSITLPQFFVSTGEAFLEFMAAVKPDPATGQPSPAAVHAFLAKHPESAPVFAQGQAQAWPVSFATQPYFAVHTFFLVNADGTKQPVKYRWEPDAGVVGLDEAQAATQGPNYLMDEISARIGQAPVGMTLSLQLGQDGDITDDATVAWPDDRPTIVAGHLSIEQELDDAGQLEYEMKVFDPTNVIAGIECSADPILHLRRSAYAVSHTRRAHERGQL